VIRWHDQDVRHRQNDRPGISAQVVGAMIGFALVIVPRSRRRRRCRRHARAASPAASQNVTTEFVLTDSPAQRAHHHHPDLSIDQRHALNSAAARLEREFAGTIGVETVDRLLNSSYAQLASRATIPNFLPLLAERFARQRLHALARVEGHVTDGKPTVVFLCTHNAGRSQMALGFLTHLAGDQAVAWSGGSEPATEVNPAAIQAMAEVGIDISGEFPKPWTYEIIRAADVVVTMGCGDASPVFPGRRYEEWVLPDPAGLGVEAVRPIRDDIEDRVSRLLADLNITTMR
jgi:arsenate reductase